MNRLYFGDNLDVPRRYVDNGSVDLIYLDPPFNSDAKYNVLFETPENEKGKADKDVQMPRLFAATALKWGSLAPGTSMTGNVWVPAIRGQTGIIFQYSVGGNQAVLTVPRG
jgi:site-specific DNA-methyltransferase (adenine-specific)